LIASYQTSDRRIAEDMITKLLPLARSRFGFSAQALSNSRRASIRRKAARSSSVSGPRMGIDTAAAASGASTGCGLLCRASYLCSNDMDLQRELSITLPR
jgi:hypothetical protein